MPAVRCAKTTTSAIGSATAPRSPASCAKHSPTPSCSRCGCSRTATRPTRRWSRSEEHTSELQSPKELVCRSLIEKKKEEEKGGAGAEGREDGGGKQGGGCGE